MNTKELETNDAPALQEYLQEYLKTDRQWPRHLRIAHARYELKQSKSAYSQAFWHAVIKANET